MQESLIKIIFSDEIAVLSKKLRDSGIHVIPVHITEKCTKAEKEDISILCPEIELLEKWSFPYESMDRPMLPFSMQNTQKRIQIP